MLLQTPPPRLDAASTLRRVKNPPSRQSQQSTVATCNCHDPQSIRGLLNRDCHDPQSIRGLLNRDCHDPQSICGLLNRDCYDPQSIRGLLNRDCHDPQSIRGLLNRLNAACEKKA